MGGLESGPSKPKVVFFGSGPVAAKSLELLARNFEIEAVVTKPKPAHHHGRFPVIDIAGSLKLPLKTVTNKADLDELIATKPFTSEVGVLIDFGIIVSQKVIDYFEKGIVNSHFSLLPEWRGADPITFSILSGQKRTGVSLMLLVEKMDEGPIIACSVQGISDEETTPSLTEKLIYLSNELLEKEIPRYLSGEVESANQDQMAELVPDYPSEPTYSRKLTKEDGRIDWNNPAKQIEREIRAFIEWPKSYTTLGGIDVILTKAFVVPSVTANSKPGDITIVDEISGLGVVTGNGTLWISRIKPAGKQEMLAAEFVRGYGKNL